MTKTSLRSRFQQGWENSVAAPPFGSENGGGGIAMAAVQQTFQNAGLQMPPPPPPPPLFYQDETIGMSMPGSRNTTTTMMASPPSSKMHGMPSSFKTGGVVATSTPPSSPQVWKTVLLTTPSPTATVSTAAMTPMSGATSPALSSAAPVFTPTCGTENNNMSIGFSPTSPRPHRLHPYQESIHYLSVPPSPPSLVNGSPYYHNKSPRKHQQHHASPTNKHRVSPTTKKATDSPHSKKKKTELCLHYLQKKVCPWGDNCTYAHGESELQHKTLRDLQRKGLLDDVENYRTKPCFAFVSMGSCPFGRRCNSIHDPRIAGKVASWLPLTETQGNNIATDINVEGLHQKRHYAILAGNPFGEQFSLELDDWNDLYKLVTNNNHTSGGSQKRRRNSISEVHKLSMAIQMRQSHEWMYKFCPQHVIFQEHCMVLQQKAFLLESNSGNAVPMSLDKYKASNSKHVMVHELAFGPDADPSVRGVALWFNLPTKEVIECTEHQAKRFRWRKTSKFDDAQDSKKKVSPFDLRECFAMIRPHDEKAFDLCTEILEHRFATVKAERLTTMGDRFEQLKELKRQRGLLQDNFEYQKRDWIAWTYPVNNGRRQFDEDAPVPPVDAEYKPIIDESAMAVDQPQIAVTGSAIQGIWGSFVATLLEESQDDTMATKTSQHEVVGLRKSFGYDERLSIFVRLSKGEMLSPDRTLPLITTSVVKKKRFRGLKASEYNKQSERCWKSLLLINNKNAKNGNSAEWDIVKDHFQNFSRSKKVLSMIQQ